MRGGEKEIHTSDTMEQGDDRRQWMYPDSGLRSIVVQKRAVRVGAQESDNGLSGDRGAGSTKRRAAGLSLRSESAQSDATVLCGTGTSETERRIWSKG